ncbi:hypothetical protein [Streptococcus ruminantium]|uniref:hypothetical protein n=1 Tax=Streptococcus ruminantium TaxID=1917441 RepID=UPI0012DFC6AB|nr:hypothetical protein [Streptococcus ruminantium]
MLRRIKDYFKPIQEEPAQPKSRNQYDYEWENIQLRKALVQTRCEYLELIDRYLKLLKEVRRRTD